mgnify:CR=1 FL=1
MDDVSNPSGPDARATRQDLLLRRLAQMLGDLRRLGIAGPAAFEELLDRTGTPVRPAR